MNEVLLPSEDPNVWIKVFSWMIVATVAAVGLIVAKIWKKI